MRELINTITEDENDIVSEALSGILSHRIKFFTKEDKDAAIKDIQDFMDAYPYRKENRMTNYFCRVAYQKLTNAGVVAEVIRQRNILN